MKNKNIQILENALFSPFSAKFININQKKKKKTHQIQMNNKLFIHICTFQRCEILFPFQNKIAKKIMSITDNNGLNNG